MVTDIGGLATVDKPEQSHSAYAYKYDQLQRIKVAKNAALEQGNFLFQSSYSSEYTYDNDGNLKTLQRTGSNDTPMDDLTYNYLNGNTNISNRLLGIDDQVSAGNFPNDLEGTQYTYDAIGNLKSDSHEGLTNVEWDAFHKIKKISKTTTGDLNYQYDPNGQRVVKSNSDNGHADYYVRDPQGNILSIYTYLGPESQEPVQSEINLYGSNRLGVYTRSRPGFTNMDLNPDNVTGARTRAYKHYELSNHLGNVLTTVSDRKIGNNPNGSLVEYYTAEILSASDYDPFGMQLDGRIMSSSTYRFGFNGKENDNDAKGDGNQQDYGMRIYDPRVGRFLSVDPLTRSYPWYTPYQFAGNSPIQAIDLDGEEREITVHTIGKGNDGYFLISSYTVTKNSVETNLYKMNIYADYSDPEKYRDVGKLQVYEFVGAKGKARIESYSVGLFEWFFGGNVRQNGIAFVMEDGQGRENRRALNFEEINIDDLMAVLGVAKETNTPGFRHGKFLGRKIQELFEQLNEVLELADFASDSYGAGKALHDADYEKPFDPSSWMLLGFDSDKEVKPLNRSKVDTVPAKGKLHYRNVNTQKDTTIPGTGLYERKGPKGPHKSQSVKPLQKYFPNGRS